MTKQAIVIGGGPVGCVLSVLLTRHGWQVEGMRLWKRFGERLTARLERQQTLSGIDNDQSRIGLQYQALDSLLLGVAMKTALKVQRPVERKMRHVADGNIIDQAHE